MGFGAVRALPGCAGAPVLWGGRSGAPIISMGSEDDPPGFRTSPLALANQAGDEILLLINTTMTMSHRRRRRRILAALLIVCGGVALYFLVVRTPPPPSPAAFRNPQASA